MKPIKNILYLDGSNIQSETAQKLQNLVDEEFGKGQMTIRCINYTQQDCKKAVAEIKQYCLDNQINVIVGKSLGSFLALCITNFRRIVINPRIPQPTEFQSETTAKTYEETAKTLEPLLDDIEEHMLIHTIFDRQDKTLSDKDIEHIKHIAGSDCEFVNGNDEALKAVVAQLKKPCRLDLYSRAMDEYPNF